MNIQRKKTMQDKEDSSLCCIDLLVEDRIPAQQSVVYYIEDQSLQPENAELEQTEDQRYALATMS